MVSRVNFFFFSVYERFCYRISDYINILMSIWLLYLNLYLNSVWSALVFVETLPSKKTVWGLFYYSTIKLSFLMNMPFKEALSNLECSDVLLSQTTEVVIRNLGRHSFPSDLQIHYSSLSAFPLLSLCLISISFMHSCIQQSCTTS